MYTDPALCLETQKNNKRAKGKETEIINFLVKLSLIGVFM